MSEQVDPMTYAMQRIEVLARNLGMAEVKLSQMEMVIETLSQQEMNVIPFPGPGER